MPVDDAVLVPVGQITAAALRERARSGAERLVPGFEDRPSSYRASESTSMASRPRPIKRRLSQRILGCARPTYRRACLITQRSEVQILPPLPRRPLSESLSVLRRKGPDHSWQQFGSKHRRPVTRPRRGTQTHHSWLVGSLGWKPSGLDAAPQAERDLRQAASSAAARVGHATRSHCAGLDFASARSRLMRSFLH
jgi:hypothetical protein